MTIQPIPFTGLIVVGMTIVVLHYFRHLISFRKWPRISGAIVESEVAEGLDRSAGRTGYFSKIAYIFTVRGRKYKNANIYSMSLVARSRVDILRSKASVERQLSNWPVGASVVIAYNPKNPDMSFLVNGPVTVIVLLLVAYLMVLSVFVFLVCSKYAFS